MSLRSEKKMQYVIVVKGSQEPYEWTTILEYLSDVEELVVESLKKDGVLEIEIRKEEKGE